MTGATRDGFECPHPLDSEEGLLAELKPWEPISKDDPLFGLVGVGSSGIKGGISGDKYRQFPRAFIGG